jgi:hypothetical protein
MKDVKCVTLNGVTKNIYTGWVFATFTFVTGSSQPNDKIIFNLLNV